MPVVNSASALGEAIGKLIEDGIEHILKPVCDELLKSVELTLKSGEDWVKRINEYELFLKTDRHEYFTYSFNSTKEVIHFLLNLQDDAPDLTDRL